MTDKTLFDDVLSAMRDDFGERWDRDDEANLRFAADIEAVLRDIDGAHLLGDPELEDSRLRVTLWVDFPLEDLMAVDVLAYDVFGRICEEIFYTERRFEAKSVRYPFLTGSARHGHVGDLVLAGPHAAEFVDRLHLRGKSGPRYHA